MLAEERFKLTVKVKAILLVSESVPFVVLDHVDDFTPRTPHSLDNLIRLGLVDSRIVRTLRDKQRYSDIVRVENGRNFPQ